MSYPPYGPWTDNLSPGISAEFLNPLESFLQTINSASTDSHITADGSGLMTLLGLVNNAPPVTVNGTTAGSAQLYQFLRGSVKGILVHFTGYRNSTTTEQTLALPQPFTTYGLFLAGGGNPPIHIYLSGSVVSSRFDVVNGFPTAIGNPGASNINSVINGLQFGDVQNAFDAIGLGISQTQTFTAGVLIIGI